MKYFKLIKDQQIIGAASSDDFIYYSPIVDCYLRTTEENGEYISFQNRLYRDTWMSPMKLQENYTSVQVTMITEEEYNILMQAINNNETIIEDEDDTELPNYDEEQIIPDDGTLDFIRSSKISEMSYQCRKAIENGIDINIRGETKHFSLTTQDQFNLISLSAMAQTSDIIPYHADGEACIYYTAEEINQIIAAVNSHKIWHTTYYNALKAYINSLETIEEISSVTYGMPIPDEYKTEVLKVISHEA